MTPPRVDGHCHIFTQAMPLAAGAASKPAYDYPVEAYLADLDKAGVAYGVIAAASMFDDGNAYTLAALKAHKRLRGTVIVSPDTDLATLRDMAGQGVVGVRWCWRNLKELPALDAEPYRGFLARLVESGLHVELLADSPKLPILLPQLAAAGVKVVVDHFGVPSADPAERQAGTDALLRAIDTGRTWAKISASFRMPFEIAEEVGGQLLAHAGTERVIWGSDAPFVNHERETDYADALDRLQRLVPDAGMRAAIDRTALTLYFSE